MFKGNRKYYIVLGLIFVAVILLYYFQPKPINWNRSYDRNEKIPFGCYAVFNLLEGSYATSVITSGQSLYNLNEGNEGAGQSLLIIDNTVSLSRLEIKSLLSFVGKGNTVLLCGSHFGKELCDTFKLDVDMNFGASFSAIDSILKKPAFEVRYVQPKNNILRSYTYPVIANESYFAAMDTALFRVSALNKKQKPVLLEATIGKGKLLLCTLPDVFGNLFIVDHPNRYFAYTLLSKLRNETIIWDEYYKSYRKHKESLFAFIFSSDALYMAYGIILLGLMLFMLFELRRKQRVVPVIRPLKNTTLEFVDVVSQVYFNANNHKHIAEETIKYFYFDLSRKFHLSLSVQDEDLYKALHNLSGVETDKICALLAYCENLRRAPSLGQYDLLELNDRITKFKQQSIR